MKKKGFILAFLSSILVSMKFVSAVDLRDLSQNFIDTWVDILEPVLRALLGGGDWTGFLLFEKLLLFLILLALIYVSLERIPFFKEQKFAKWIIVIVVPLMAVRFITYDWLTAIINQYTLLAIVLTAFLPFLVYFYFINALGEENSFIRRAGWVLFAFVYTGLWSGVGNEAHSEIYFWTFTVSLIMAIFDGTIHRHMARRVMKKSQRGFAIDAIARIDEQILRVQASYIPESAKKTRIKQLERSRDHWIKNI